MYLKLLHLLKKFLQIGLFNSKKKKTDLLHKCKESNSCLVEVLQNYIITRHTI